MTESELAEALKRLTWVHISFQGLMSTSAPEVHAMDGWFGSCLRLKDKTAAAPRATSFHLWFCKRRVLLFINLFNMHRWFLSSRRLGCVIASSWGYTLVWSEAGVTARALRRKEHASCGIWMLSKLGLFSRCAVTFSSKTLHRAVFYFPHITLRWAVRNSGSAATSPGCVCLGVTGIPPPSYGSKSNPAVPL